MVFFLSSTPLKWYYLPSKRPCCFPHILKKLWILTSSCSLPIFFPAPDPLFRPLIQGFHLHLDLLLGFDRWPDIKKKATDWAKLNFSSQSRTWSPPLYWCNPPHFPLSCWGGDETKKIIAFTSFLYSIWALNAVMSFLDDWFIPLLLESLHFSDIFSENTVGQKIQN